MFIAALFKIAEIWKHLKGPSIDERIYKMWYIYTMEYYSAIKRMKSCICENMDGPRGYYANWNKSDKETEIPYDFTYMSNLKNKTSEQI